MKEFILIAIALFNIYNNGLVIMRSIENCGITWVKKGTDGLCESEEDVVRGISRDYSFVASLTTWFEIQPAPPYSARRNTIKIVRVERGETPSAHKKINIHAHICV